MAPQYKLTYFNLRAAAEPTRLLFAHANVEYEDNRVDKSDWPALKPNTPWGKVPYLEEGDFKLAQSHAILKYLGAKYGYYGRNVQETAKIDEMIEALNDLRDVYISFFREENPEKKAEKEKKMKEESVPYYYGKFNSVLEKNGKYLVGDKITIADFYYGANLQTFDVLVGGNSFENYPALKAHQQTVLESPGIKEWVAKRPVTEK